MQRTSDSIACSRLHWPRRRSNLPTRRSRWSGPSPGRGEGRQRLFRYASLSSGLDIVRKTLGQHEIATAQTTAIDQSAGIVNLTTVLAHASGGMDRLGLAGLRHRRDRDPASDGRGADLRRRDALFTLVGIAGEDDLMHRI